MTRVDEERRKRTQLDSRNALYICLLDPPVGLRWDFWGTNNPWELLTFRFSSPEIKSILLVWGNENGNRFWPASYRPLRWFLGGFRGEKPDVTGRRRIRMMRLETGELETHFRGSSGIYRAAGLRPPVRSRTSLAR